jgi:hypothetical protein
MGHPRRERHPADSKEKSKFSRMKAILGTACGHRALGGLCVDGFVAFQAGEALDGSAGFLLGEAQVVESL